MKLFFDLLLVSTGARDSLRMVYSEGEWKRAFAIAQEQTLTAVLMNGLERLSDEQKPPKVILLKWIALTQLAEKNTRAMTKAGEDAVRYFRENNFACTLLKGTAVGRYYPLPDRRTSGDVDIWLKGSREEIYDFARRFDKDGKLYGVNYHHIHYHLFDDIEVEAHIWPSFLSSPIRNSRLHKFCNMHRPTMEVSMPCLAFDRVFILLHCYRHMCGHGLGFRQIMDYYYVLKQGFTEDERHDSVYWIKHLGMERFAKGIMWLLRRCFGLEEEYLLMEQDEKEGRFIMREVMLTGNMGHSEKRNWGSLKTPFSRFKYNIRRDTYLARHYPHEALWQPFFSIWLYFWRLSKGLLRNRE